MTYGVIQAGRISLREDSSVQISPNDAGTQLEITGQESYGRLALPQLRQRPDEIMALSGQMISLSLSQKTHLSGYYWVDEASGRYEEWQPEAVAVMPWSLRLTRIGYSTEVDLESRLAGPLTRANDHAGAGERWHAPPPAHTAYSAGASVPSVVTRTGSEGAITVYRNVATGVHPHWTATPTEYLGARVRYLDDLGIERQALHTPLPATGWTVHNGLVRLTIDPGDGSLVVAAWTGGAWQAKAWHVRHGVLPGAAMGAPTQTTLLHNTFEKVTVRMMKALNPGRITVDATLRRGSRFLELYIQHQFGTTLSLTPVVAEAGSSSPGYLTASADDAAGNRYVAGSTRTFAVDGPTGTLSKDATATLDAFIGVQVGGAAAGDLALDLFKQYLGVTEEQVRGVTR